MQTWQIGDVKVTRVIEMELAGGSRFILPQATPEEILEMPWLMPHFASEEGKLIMSIHALIVETPTKKIMVDTCIGNDKQRSNPNWSHLQLPFLDDLKTAGYDREDIDTVLCTHLHVDHVGWNTMLVDDKWIPTFPNARYLLARKEFEYWDQVAIGEDEDDILSDSVRPVFDAGLVDLVDMEHRICDEVCLEPTTGHTPGHVSVHISSGGKEALITGDCIHHPCQIEKLEWSSSFDYDPDESVVTRQSLMDQYADKDILIIGTHFASPTAGYLKQGPGGYWLDVGS
ncbi:MAG: MBL fold metallo-hydrolase [Proteobacteria bacterium]|nr:MBL fold metallo-hydrolase [Pseudomonadota bacterium]